MCVPGSIEGQKSEAEEGVRSPGNGMRDCCEHRVDSGTVPAGALSKHSTFS